MQEGASDTNNDEDIEMGEESINTTALFSVDDIRGAMKSSNFNKGLGPDCFDGNMMRGNEQLCGKLEGEITNALNNAFIPDYLKVGRLVPL